MIRPLGLMIATVLFTLGSCGGSQQPSASSPPAAAAMSAGGESSALAEEASVPPDSTPKAKDQSKEADGACDADSASRECKCEQGDIEACMKVADAAFRGGDHDQAIIRTYSLCQQGRSEACFRAAYYMKKIGIQQRFGTSPAKLHDKAVAIDKDGCAKGDAAACFGYGKLLFNGKYVAAETAQGVQHLEASCSGGHAPACSFLARVYETGAGGLKKDRKRALQLLENSCNSGGVASCTFLGDEIARKETAKARGLYEKACGADDALGCARLGQIHLKATKFADAHVTFVKACELEHSESCVEAGALVESGKGTSKEPEKSRELYKVACDEEFAPGCLSLAVMISKGLGGKRNWGQAIGLSEKACSLNLKKACKETGRLKRNPPDWRCDTEAACEALCSELIGRSCTRLGDLLADKETAPLVKSQLGKPKPEDGWLWPTCDSANDAYERGCKNGDRMGCLRIGKSEQECHMGIANGCEEFKAAQYEHADERERKKILRELNAACTRRKSVDACMQLSRLTKRDQPAKRVIERLCRAGNGAACAAQTGFIYIRTWGIGDGSCHVMRRGVEVHKERCTYKEHEEKGKRTEALVRQKAKLLGRACELGRLDSCFHDDFRPAVAQKMADHGLQLLTTQSCGRGGL
ncbi:MAG: sel1 repeat family protein [Myxococcales bacterium]|nr:sel1 repeat family protein [Myxococcales bacterium]